ncbi:HET-domain-containing protein [Aulographum hederae CBS 113979]|uniref:HET-domain-containing protein n=1 Tax=Aulographum hederae CBS 113979 TaxID=1176131 RepID=A0A6G1GVC3_9PEZI|nr:HET-domain-containing protein [Aulographum hederae CBS 113979]
MPSRLVDVGTNGLSPRIVETKSSPFTDCALSYCWGGDQPYKLTKSNLSEHKLQVHIPPEAKTIHDALVTTWNLGLRYIWIDALCIIQDDDADMERELARMPGIYKGAHVTVVAGSAQAYTEGFLERRTKEARFTYFHFPYRCTGGELGSVYWGDDYDPYDSYEPLHDRAWALQESTLSPRLLEFSRKCMSWSCFRLLKTDGGRYGHLRGGISDLRRTPWPPKNMEIALKHWRDIVQHQTGRSLTAPHDKLAAIAGIAEGLSRSM